MKFFFKKYIYYILALACVGVLTLSFRKRKIENSNGTAICVENKNLYEPFLTPTRQDTVEWQRIKQRFSKTYSTGHFRYEMIPIVRGLIDTQLLSNQRFFNNSGILSDDYRREIVMSPLIIEGTVIETDYQDTTEPNSYMYNTCLIVRVDDVVKSKYKIAIGDLIVVKTNLYGYCRDPQTNQLGFMSIVGASVYRDDQKCLFVLDKYFYMLHCHDINLKHAGYENFNQYCAYSFSMDLNADGINQEYQKNRLSKTDIINFIK